MRIPFTLRKSRLLSGRRYTFAVFCIKYSILLKGFRKAVQFSVCRKIPYVSFFICFPFFALAFGVGAAIGGRFLRFVPCVFHVEFCIDCLAHFRMGFGVGAWFLSRVLYWFVLGAAVWRSVFSLLLGDFYDDFCVCVCACLMFVPCRY